MELSSAPVCVFQNLMQRSAVPPPEASRLACAPRPARRVSGRALACGAARLGAEAVGTGRQALRRLPGSRRSVRAEQAPVMV